MTPPQQNQRVSNFFKRCYYSTIHRFQKRVDTVKSAPLKRKSPRRKITIYHIVDSCQVPWLVASFITLVIVSAVGYWGLTYWWRGIHGLCSTYQSPTCPFHIDILESLYFSVITVSSLGYGDYRPIGLGRFLAASEVIIGITIMSLTVAKLSSERSNFVVKLLYSSNNETRTRQYIQDLETYLDWMNAPETNFLYPNASDPMLERVRKLVGGISNYMLFHGGRGMLVEMDSQNYLRKLFKKLAQVQYAILHRARGTDTPKDAIKSLERIAVTIVEIARAYESWSRDTVVTGTCSKIIGTNSAYGRTSGGWYKKRLLPVEVLAERVKVELPDPPWPTGIHKDVASNLGISISAVTAAINYFINNPPQVHSQYMIRSAKTCKSKYIKRNRFRQYRTTQRQGDKGSA